MIEWAIVSGDVSAIWQQMMWLVEGRTTPKAKGPLHDLLTEGLRLVSLLQATRGLLVITCPYAEARRG